MMASSAALSAEAAVLTVRVNSFMSETPFFVIVAVRMTVTSLLVGRVTVPSSAMIAGLLLFQVMIEPFAPVEASSSFPAEVTVVGVTVRAALSAATSSASCVTCGARPPCHLSTGKPPLMLFSASTLKALSVGLRVMAKASSFISDASLQFASPLSSG